MTNRRGKYCAAIVPLLLAGMLLLTGCGKKEITKTTFSFTKDGKVVHTIVEDSEGEDTAAMEEWLRSEAEDFCSTAGPENVTVDSFTVSESGIVTVQMTYSDSTAFERFCNADSPTAVPFFYGTVKEAYDKGMDLNVSLQNADGTASLEGKEDLLTQGDAKILIYDNAVNCGEEVEFVFPGKIAYFSDHVTVTGDKAAETSGESGQICILLQNK